MGKTEPVVKVRRNVPVSVVDQTYMYVWSDLVRVILAKVIQKSSITRGSTNWVNFPFEEYGNMLSLDLNSEDPERN